ncbi:MAG TPA: CRISPR-associated protein Cas5 [Clostridia bacterium]
MLKCIRLKAYQTYANYKKPTAIDVGESYLLPAPSTVIGMLHNVCGFKSYHPLKISIQGIHSTLTKDLYTRYFFGTSYEPERHQYKVRNLKGGYDGITRGLGNNILLIGVNLLIHILPENDEDFDVIFSKLKNPEIYPALGRYEDLLRIDEVSIVEIEPASWAYLKYDAYIPVDMASEELTYPVHNLNKVYTLSQEDNTRVWQKIKCYQVKSDKMLSFKDGAYKEAHTDNGVFFI